MAKKRPKTNSYLLSASDVLQSLLQNKKSPLSDPFLRWRLWRHWEEVVGQTVAEHTAPVGYEKGRLYVWVTNSVRLQELTFVVKSLKGKINSYLGKSWVRSIRFTLDRKAVPKLEETDEGLRDYLSKSPPNEDVGPRHGR